MEPTTIIAARVRDQRKALGLSQRELAERLGVTQPAIQYLENGRTRDPGFIVELAAALSVSAEYLRGYTDDPAPAGISDEKREFLALIENADLDLVRHLRAILESYQRKGAV